MKSSYINRETRDFERNSLNRIAVITSLKEVVEQRIWIRLGINRGEWIFDKTIGVPWYELLNGGATPEQIRAEVQLELNNEEYVKIVEYVRIDNIDRAKRKLSLSFSVILTTGESLTSSGEVSI